MKDQSAEIILTQDELDLLQHIYENYCARMDDLVSRHGVNTQLGKLYTSQKADVTKLIDNIMTQAEGKD
jgi:hypothetical protein